MDSVCIGRCKSNYHTITATLLPLYEIIQQWHSKHLNCYNIYNIIKFFLIRIASISSMFTLQDFQSNLKVIQVNRSATCLHSTIFYPIYFTVFICILVRTASGSCVYRPEGMLNIIFSYEHREQSDFETKFWYNKRRAIFSVLFIRPHNHHMTTKH